MEIKKHLNKKAVFSISSLFLSLLLICSLFSTPILIVDAVVPPLEAFADANPTEVCIGEMVNFYGDATGGVPPYSWHWDFDDGQWSDEQNPSHQYISDGTYTVTLTVTDENRNSDSRNGNGGDTATDTVTITVVICLSCDAGGPYSGTICGPVQFSGDAWDGVLPYSFNWDFGDGSSGSGQNPSHQYTIDGTYTVTMTVTDSGYNSCEETTTVTISTTSLSANAGGPYEGTICNPIQFSGSASGGCLPYSYHWDFGDGSSSTQQNPNHQYTSDGAYTATLTVTDDVGQEYIDTAAVTISTPPLSADAGGPHSGYVGDLIQFSGSANGGCPPYSYSWDFGDGTTGTGSSPSHSYSNEGWYTVILTVTDDVGETAMDETTVEIIYVCMDPVYVDDNFNYDTPGFNIDHFHTIQAAVDRVCPGGTVYVYNGTYYEDVVISTEDILIIGVYEPPLHTTGQTSAYVQGRFIVATDGITIKNLVFASSTLGAILISEDVNADTITIHHNKFLLECDDDAIGVINAGSGMVDARFNWWDMSNGPSGGVADPVTGRIASGYGVGVGANVLFDPWAGVSAIAQASATVVETGTPVVFDSSESFAMRLDGTSNTYSVFWDFDDGVYSTQPNPTHVFSTPGIYTISLRVKGIDTQLLSGFMFDWDYVTIQVYQLGSPLSANADDGNLGGYETTIGDTVQLFGSATGGTPPYKFSWDLGIAGTSSSQNPMVTFNEEGIHMVTLTVTDSEFNMAIDTAEVIVEGIDSLTVSMSIPTTIALDTPFVLSCVVDGGKSPYTYHWDLGDGVSSMLANPTHTYTTEGVYTVTLTVTDVNNDQIVKRATIDVQGEEEHESVTITNVKGGLFVSATIAADDIAVQWSIEVEGRVFLGGTASGTISAGTQSTVKLPLTVGFGKVDVIITANEVQESYTAFALGSLFMNMN